MNKLLTNSEAADMLGLSLSGFYKLARKQIPGIHLGTRTVRFNQSDVEAYVASKAKDRANA